MEQFNIGKDATLSVVGPGGALAALGLLTEYEMNPESNIVTSLPLNLGGLSRHRSTRQGWRGYMAFDRFNGRGDELEASLEANYIEGGPEIYFQINDRVRNADGSVNNIVYVGVVIVMEQSGRRSQIEKIQQRFGIRAAQRVVT